VTATATATAVAARALAAGPGAWRALAGGASGSVELAFAAGGGYVLLDTGWVLVARPRAPAGPLSLLVVGLPGDGLRPGAPASVACGRLAVGGLEIALSAARRRPPPPSLALRTGWRDALAAALARVTPPPPDLGPGLEALASGDLASAAMALAGRGDGLTPAGDDVLAGAAAWRWNRGAPAGFDRSGCAPLGRAYLACAERGELPDPARAVLEAICAGDAPAAARRAGRLRAWGASSGTALLWGMAAAAGHPPATG
jgi:hypothetical protein